MSVGRLIPAGGRLEVLSLGKSLEVRAWAGATHRPGVVVVHAHETDGIEAAIAEAFELSLERPIVERRLRFDG